MDNAPRNREPVLPLASARYARIAQLRSVSKNARKTNPMDIRRALAFSSSSQFSTTQLARVTVVNIVVNHDEPLSLR